ncbi:hypothetical protein PR202_gb19074 [Eleusine coracana subsp. coracana]|uniref:Uncharacterized protein n=1 Tax=Eleusine coracana subsp. coracana TaxID=191504 RepID=A0AAV5F732_ELECO|nr:hypothetical protein PR202_gb19074 [Eleusine coracana subsp. coracana]
MGALAGGGEVDAGGQSSSGCRALTTWTVPANSCLTQRGDCERVEQQLDSSGRQYLGRCDNELDVDLCTRHGLAAAGG